LNTRLAGWIINAMIGAKWMTYAELGEMIGGTPEAGRQLALRLKLRKQVGNEDKRVRVWVDEETVTRRNARPTPVQKAVERAPQTPVQQDVQTGEINALREHLETMERLMAEQRADHQTALDLLRAAHAAELERALAEQMRLIEERGQFQDKLQEARAEADAAKADQVRMARDVATMFDELRTLADRHAEVHGDRARLQAELESARVRIIDLHSQSTQARKEAEDAQAHSRNLAEQFERVHREHRIDVEHERRSWWQRIFGRHS
jgi:chromosome segregation ATPase